MSDPRLNSIHLTANRREKFRLARQMLLNARGDATLVAEMGPGEASQALSSPTLIPKSLQNSVPQNVVCWLEDGENHYPLKIGLNTIGRSSENDVVIRDGYVSRRHCAILVHSDFRCEIHDVASKNGTFLNGAKLRAPTRLRSGDKIRMCDLTLHFQARSAHGSSANATRTLS